MLCFEGTVTGVRTKQYAYQTQYPGKFGAETMTIDHDPVSLLTTFRIQHVWHGNGKRFGGFITLEDVQESGACGESFGYRKGVNYLVIVQELDRDTLYIGAGETYLSGDITLDSRFATYYPYQPQIERTRTGDYIVPTTWQWMTKSSTTVVRLDEAAVPETKTWEYEFFKDKLRLVKCEAFEARMEELTEQK